MLTLPSTTPLPQPAVTEGAIACVGCGYDLRATPADGRCPECDTPVEASRRSHDPRWWPASWWRRQRVGAALLVACYLFSGITMSAESLGVSQRFGYGGAVVAGLQMVPLVLLGVGAWLVTSRPTRRPVRRGAMLVRWLCVLFVGIAAFNIARNLTTWQTGPTIDFGVFAPVSALAVLHVMYLAAMGLGWVGLLCVQAATAARLGARRTRAMLWAAIVLWGGLVMIAAAYYILTELTSRSLYHRSDPAYLLLVALGATALLVSAVAYLRLVLRTRSLL